MRNFTDGQTVKVADTEHPLVGKAGTVVRRRMADDGAWVRMVDDIPTSMRQFSDERKNNVLLYPYQCEPA
ncbi:MAG: hypothetical protein U0990_12555 [Candidatus Nanopelagicales bacterium]|nr:hypothetical protein [Candidatus Nanopelagicales bacterium]